MHHNAKGIALISCEWVATAIELLAVTLRLYSRTFLTRSVGSDDFFISIGFVRLVMNPNPRNTADIHSQALEVVATVSDLEAFLNGWSQHEDSLTKGQYSSEEKW